MKSTILKIRHRILIVASLAAILSILPSCRSKKGDKSDKQPIKTVAVAEAYTDSVVLYKSFPGLLTTQVKTNVVARVNGKILSINYTPGQYVTKGQTLFTIESTTYRNAVERAEAALATARSQHEYYSKQTAAMQKALEADAVSKLQVIQAQSNKEQAEASIREAQANLSNARQNLSYCTVTAPSSGYISAPVYDAGNYVSGEGEAATLATIYDNSNLQAVFSISDRQYEQVRTATGGIESSLFRNVPLQFREKLPNTYTTNLYYEAPSVDTSTASLVMKGTVDNRDNELKDGMYVTVSLPVGIDPKAILVKDAALSSDQSGYYLLTLNDSNIVCHTPVKVGDVYRDSLRIINSGIEPGTRYLTKALLTVRAGERVNPKMSK